VDNVRVGDWGRCAGRCRSICTTNSPWWILSCWGFQCYSCVLGICARQISQDYCRLQVQADFGVVFPGRLDSGADGHNGWRFHQNFQRLCCRNVAQLCAIGLDRLLQSNCSFQSNLLVVDATSDVGSEIASESRGRLMRWLMRSHTACAARRESLKMTSSA
jgi:hypothetical protein